MSLTQRITNRTNHFKVGDRVYQDVLLPGTHRYIRTKTQAYETRLYYEFTYTTALKGFTAFLTLTYNNRMLPRYQGIPCFDVEDLRWLLHGKFYDRIRSLGWTFKYFVSCELGEGKGVRGYRQNPHYHVLLFLRPYEKSKVKVQNISANDIYNLVTYYWHGVNKRGDLLSNKKSNYGIVRAGKFGVEVNSYRPLQYCAKYVCKDIRMYDLEARVRSQLEKNLVNEFSSDPCNYSDYMAYCGTDVFTLPVNFSCDPDFRTYCATHLIKDELDHRMRLFRNRYSDKVRVSHGVGISGLDSIDPMDPSLMFPDKKKIFVRRPISLFYYRKLYNDIVKDEKGNNRYILNSTGIKYKSSILDKSIYRHFCDTRQLLNLVLNSKDRLPFVSDDILNVPDNILLKYSIYSIVYKYRFYVDSSNTPPDINIHSDYLSFLAPSIGGNSYFEKACYFIKEHGYPYMHWYYQHPFFSEYSELFDYLDSLADYIDKENDDKYLSDYIENERIRKLHNSPNIYI